jgi:hypothetical protein
MTLDSLATLQFRVINATTPLQELTARQYNAYGKTSLIRLDQVEPNNTLSFISGWCGVIRPCTVSYVMKTGP